MIKGIEIPKLTKDQKLAIARDVFKNEDWDVVAKALLLRVVDEMVKMGINSFNIEAEWLKHNAKMTVTLIEQLGGIS